MNRKKVRLKAEKTAEVPEYETHKGAVLSRITEQKGKDLELESFDDIRAALKLDKEQLPDGHIEQIAIDAGHEIE